MNRLRHFRRSWFASGLVCLIQLLPVEALSATGGPCEADLPRIEGQDRLAYQERDSAARCEGLYARLQSARAELSLLSLTRNFPDMDTRVSIPLEVSWPSAPGASTVRLQGNSLRYKIFYRMDAVRASSESLTWPTAILRDLDIRRPELGVLAWTDIIHLQASHRIYLPVRVSRRDVVAANAETVTAIVVPTAELGEMRLRVYFQSALGAKEEPVNEELKLNVAAYPAERPVKVPLELGARQGYYRVILSATLAKGGVASTQFRVFQDARK